MRNLAFVIFVLAICAAPAFAQNPSAHRVASDLFDRIAAPQAEPLVSQLIDDGVKKKAISPAAVEIYKEFGLEILRSPQFRQAFIDAYLKVFTEEELRSLLELSGQPVFKVYVLKSQQLHDITNPALITLMNQARPELLRRLHAAGFAQ